MILKTETGPLNLRIWGFLLPGFMLACLYFPSLAHAACTSPAGNEGDVMYNKDQCVTQFCDGTGWKAAGHPQARDCANSCAGKTADPCTGVCGTTYPNVGDVCADGSVYAGRTSDGGVPMFAQRCDIGQSWNGSACTGSASYITWDNGNAVNYTTTNVTSTWAGKSNTTTLNSLDSDSGTAGTQPHLAAQICVNLNEDGHTDWYLPAKDELNILYTGRVAIGNFDTSGGVYWSSTEYDNADAWLQYFFTPLQAFNTKNALPLVRCVRR